MWLVLFFHWPQRKMWFLFLFCDLLQVWKRISCTRYLLDVIQRSTFQNIILITPVVWLVHSEWRLQRQISLNIDFSFIAGLDTPLGKDAHPWMRTQHTSLHAHAKHVQARTRVESVCGWNYARRKIRMAFENSFLEFREIIFLFLLFTRTLLSKLARFLYAHIIKIGRAHVWTPVTL